jgi:hypothetical protein
MKLIKLKIFIGFLFFVTSTVRGNDTLQITQLLNRISSLQNKEHGVFPKGLFPCYRMYALNKNREIADPNIAFTGYIVYTLRSLLPALTAHQQSIAKQIILNATEVFKKFKNQKGRSTYNFWRTDTVAFFPNSGFLSHLTKTHALADDLDDTSLILMGLLADSSTAQETHTIMQGFVKNNSKEINSFFFEYKDLNTYSTWFGKKMPAEIDVAVLCNVLLFVQSYNLPWTKTDSASLQLITQVIKDKKHIREAAYMSHYYSTPSLILYHVARLMNKKEIPALNQLKPQMIVEVKELFSTSTSFLEKIILSSILLQWNEPTPSSNNFYTHALASLIEDDRSFAFFVANLAYLQLGIPDGLKKWSGKMGIGKFYFYCPAYNNLLVVENLVLNNRIKSASSN